MTLPDDLVMAARDAHCVVDRTDRCNYADPRGSGHGGLKHPECVLAAVLRALPECDKAITAGGYALMQVEGADHPDLDYSLSVRKGEARIVLAAIAKLADDA